MRNADAAQRHPGDRDHGIGMDTPPFIEELAQLIGVNVLDVDPDKVVTDARAMSDIVPNLTIWPRTPTSTMERATEATKDNPRRRWRRTGSATAAACTRPPPR